MKSRILGLLVTILVAILVFFVGTDYRVAGDPLEVFQVYLDGKKIGLIENKDDLFNLIDTEQTEIKDTYKVDKVYPPDGLDVKKIYTYDDNITEVENIYNEIKDIEPFTIEGYKATITYTERKVMNDGDIIEPGEPVYLYVLDKDIVAEALYNVASAFIGPNDLKNYEEGTQVEITDTGENITSVYFEETLTIKSDLVSTAETIFSDVDTLTRYLLYGTLENQENYVTKEGDDLESIANNNNLNIDELLIANPQFAAANVLLSPGENVNVGLINPLVSVVYNKVVVSDEEINYKTEYEDDSTKYNDYQVTKQKGENGLRRLTSTIKYVNGEIQDLHIDKTDTIKDPINEVIVRGTKTVGGGYYYYVNSQGNEQWSWPTISPFVITSKFKWRWGRQHQGIDISGCGYGSPIYAVQSGYVYKVNYNSGLAEGLSIYIDHGNGVVTQYMHLAKILVKEGQTVSREQKIGLMGSSGSSTGTHLHLGVWVQGKPYEGGVAVDPCVEMFKC